VKLARTHAFITPGAIWSVLLPSENAALFQLQPIACKLFLALLHCIEFKTGKGQTGYPSLMSIMTPPYAGTGRRPKAPSRDDIKNALRELEAVGLIDRDAALSEDKKAIFFSVKPRTWEGVSSEQSTRLLTRRENPVNPDEHRAKRSRRGSSYPTSYPRIQESENLTIPLKVDNLSTGEKAAPSTPRGKKLTPPRGLNIAPQGGPTPPPEALTGTEQGHGEGYQVAPPGGCLKPLRGTPPGELGDDERAWAAREQAARIEAERQAWRDERAHQPSTVRVDDPSTWQRDEGGGLILPIDHPTNQARRRSTGPRKAQWS
jgi:hypothetical protein